MIQPGTLDITDRHFIIPRRDHADSCRLKPGVKNIRILLDRQRLIS